MSQKRLFREIVAFVKDSPLFLLDVKDFSLSESEEKEVEALYARVLLGEPIEYVLGRVVTKDLTLFVDQSVLIPRVETEILIEHALERMDLREAQVLDLCAGSGILGLSIKKRKPSFSVTLVDISFEALAVAKRNGESNGLEVEYILGNLLDPLRGRVFDYVLCNPPYVSEEEYKYLDKGVKDFEPKLALVGGEDGLFFYKRLAKELPFYLSSKGKVFFEIGASQGNAVSEIFSTAGWKHVEVKKDLAGLDRFVFAEKGSVEKGE
jgi:release factor glutamine methyltransferase